MYPELREDEVREIARLIKEYNEQQASSGQRSAISSQTEAES
jgi:hypothetical protein